jgi:hypothetical protein
LVKQMDQRLQAIMKQTGDSWEIKAASGDLSAWLPGGVKQLSQTLAPDWPGKSKDADANEKGGKKKRKNR